MVRSRQTTGHKCFLLCTCVLVELLFVGLLSCCGNKLVGSRMVVGKLGRQSVLLFSLAHTVCAIALSTAGTASGGASGTSGTAHEHTQTQNPFTPLSHAQTTTFTGNKVHPGHNNGSGGNIRLLQHTF